MYRLVRLSLVSFGCLAGAQESEESVVEFERHERCHSQHRVLHHESAIQRVVLILMSVTRKMQDARTRKLFYDGVGCRRRSGLDLWGVEVAQKIDGNVRRNSRSDGLCFLGYEVQWSPFERLSDRNEEHLYFRCRYGRHGTVATCVEQSPNRGRIRSDVVVRETLGLSCVIVAINPSCVEGKMCEDTSRTYGNARTASSFGFLKDLH